MFVSLPGIMFIAKPKLNVIQLLPSYIPRLWVNAWVLPSSNSSEQLLQPINYVNNFFLTLLKYLLHCICVKLASCCSAALATRRTIHWPILRGNMVFGCHIQYNYTMLKKALTHNIVTMEPCTIWNSFHTHLSAWNLTTTQELTANAWK